MGGPEARFWGLGMLLSLVPPGATYPMDRLNLFVGIGACGLLATQAASLGLLGGDRPRAGGWRRRVTGALVWVHLPLAAPLLVLYLVAVPQVTGQVTRVGVTATGDEQDLEQRTLVLVNGIQLVSIYIPDVRRSRGLPVPRRTVQLASAFSDLRLRRLDSQTLEISVAGGMLARDVERLMWSPSHVFVPGQLRRRPDYSARVLRVTGDGRPQTVRFRFAVPLKHPSLLWRTFREGALRPFSPPPPGQTVDLPASAASLLF